MVSKMKTIELPEPHTKLYSTETVGEGLERAVVRVERTVEPFFTVAETVQLMKLYADACVGKKLLDMGYKDYCTEDEDPEGDLAKIRMLPWFRENEE